MKRIFFSSLLLISLSGVALGAPHQFTSESGLAQIVFVPSTDAMLVSLTSQTSIVNPANCSTTDSGYATHPSDGGRNLYQDFLREAYFQVYSVKLLISGTSCALNRPRIIGVLPGTGIID
ncbi:hypothetical protein [uncultured Thiothrix sp.]|uniref:hypothetical protein n=1 Tax=uncultured Thiothrix sp. TaxID=223185 RepID=UPI00260DF349|nr:hypothetical protein [uncultured Thiothrix sp.]